MLRGHTIFLSFSGPAGSTEVKLNGQVKATIEKEYRHRWHTTALCMLPQSVDLSDVEDLSLVMVDGISVSSRMVREFLFKMPKVRSCTVLVHPQMSSKYWTRCLSPQRDGSVPFPHLQYLEVVGQLELKWAPIAAQIASLILRRSQGGCDKLAELMCSTLPPSSAPKSADELRVGKHKVADMVESVRSQALDEIPLWRAADVESWNPDESNQT